MSEINDTILMGLIAQLQYKVAKLEGKTDEQAKELALNIAMAAIAAASAGRGTIQNTMISSVKQAMDSAISLAEVLDSE
ncbi:MAG: hypothetical protein AAF267_07570 [Deinococcota bacterium]|jgi:hypothetical protein